MRFRIIEKPQYPFLQLTKETLSPLTIADRLLIIGLLRMPIPISDEMAEAAQKWKWRSESNYNHKLGVSIAHAFYGEHLRGPDEIFASAQKLAAMTGKSPNDVIDKTGSTGFPELFQLTPGLKDEDYMSIQKLVARKLTQESLRNQGIKPREVDLFIVATSIPIQPDYADQIARACKIPRKTKIVRVVMACNSSGWARAQVEAGKFDHLIGERILGRRGANILLFAIDDQNRGALQGGDVLSPLYFSTGATAMTWEYGPHAQNPAFRQIAHTSLSLPTGMQYLALAQPYLGWGMTENGHNFYRAKHLSLPPNGQLINMRERVGLFFVKGAIEVTRQTLAKYTNRHKVSDIKRVIVHHPSIGVFNILGSHLTPLGFTADQLHWVITEGNVPVITMPVAYGRQLKDLEPGDHVMFLTFGAGGGYTCSIDEVGPSNKPAPL